MYEMMRRLVSPDGFDSSKMVDGSSLSTIPPPLCDGSSILSGKVYLTSVGRKDTCLKGSAVLLAFSCARASTRSRVISPISYR